ncbi:MAG: LysR family transcriptional regulator [Gordonibacter sp.]|uniref:LysR family transcriptional regulator n=1 Tax=Gordonibacter sp. TaxID=1968902 RepID=UPI002FC69DEF
MEVKDKYDYFILAYDSPSFSAGASKVPMSPQGFTKAIRNLERELGVPLFVVDEEGARRATPYADEFYEYARHMQTERNLLASAFERIASSGYVEIRVASSLGIPGLLGSDFLADFQRDHKDVSITLNELPDLLCESVLRDGMYDLALTTLPSADDFVTHELYSSPVCYWVRRDDPLSACGSLGIEDIAQRRIAIPGREFKCYRTLLDRFARGGLEPPEIVEYSEIFWIYEFVLRGEGVGFTLPHLANLEVFRTCEEVVSLPVRDSIWGFGVSHLGVRSLCQREEEFIAYLDQRASRARDISRSTD